MVRLTRNFIASAREPCVGCEQGSISSRARSDRECFRMVSSKISRRRLMAGGALASAMVAAPFVRGAYAAGKLSMGFWDHWVPGANVATEKAVKAWAEKEKVEVQIDFI